MSIVYVGLPVLYHVKRFHFDRGRRWNAVEHLLLQALSDEPRTAGQLADESGLPRRVILEVLIRLMRASWVELRAGAQQVMFHATPRGKAIAFDDDLPAITERMARRIGFAVDVITGSVFRRRDLTLLRPDDWRKRTEGYRAVEIVRPELLPQDLGHVARLLGVLFNEDEALNRVDVSDRPPMESLALFTVREKKAEGLPSRLSKPAAVALERVLVDAAQRAPSSAQASQQVSVIAPPVVHSTRKERPTTIRREDFIRGGEAHYEQLTTTLRRARRHVIIHSTFIDSGRFESLLPAFKVAAGKGCRVDILWGQSNPDGGMVKSLREAEQINSLLERAGMSGSVQVHRFSTKSHSKMLIADDGAGAFTATIGSCNWLYSGFESFEVSIRLRDPHLVADALYETAELARPDDGHLPELTARLAQTARELLTLPPLEGNARVRLLIGQEHDDCVLEARDRAARQITVLSHRLGVVAKPAIVIPLASAAQARNVSIKLFYGQPSGPVQQKDASDASWTFREQGVELIAVHRPRIHAKMLMWDEDNVVVTSLNWLSADTPEGNPRQEIGVAIKSPRAASFLLEDFQVARTFA